LSRRSRRNSGSLGEIIGILHEASSLMVSAGKKSPVEKVRNLSQTVENFLDANDPRLMARRLLVDESHRLERGDHIYVQRVGYTHHGIYVGGGRVVHYLLDHGIVEDSVENFAGGMNVHRKNSIQRYSDRETVRRAYSRIGEDQYNLFHNNCEHFATWCRNGS
jgi:hypothetical protein